MVLVALEGKVRQCNNHGSTAAAAIQWSTMEQTPLPVSVTTSSRPIARTLIGCPTDPTEMAV